MNLADVSIRRPTFITCIVLLMLAVGYLSMRSLPVDIFPDVTFPVVTVSVPYPGAGPAEIETLVSKPLEDQISTLSGIKRLSSINQEGLSQVVAEFTLETDVKYAEQQIRDRVGSAKAKLPLDIQEPVIRRIDPSDQPVLTLAISADLPPAKLFDLADDVIRPRLEQVSQVGLVEVLGGRKREVRVELDRAKLKSAELSASLVSQRLASAGENIPVGKVDRAEQQTVFRTMGQFGSIKEIQNTILSFFGNDVPVTIGDIATVRDGLVDEQSRAYINGKPSLVLYLFRQSGSNTLKVVTEVKKKIGVIQAELKDAPGAPKIDVVRDGSVWIKLNVEDVQESITIGIILAVIVVYFFLANGRSTIITGLALPNSLIGAFILMAVAGFSINVMSLLALSLSVGLLIDDAIVVRENIYRHLEMGKPPQRAAREGTAEVRLAVIATTLTVIAVFGPVGFMKGVVGQFFKQFGLTVCFAMAISLFDALTIAPMLSAYFAGHTKEVWEGKGIWARTVGQLVKGFGRFQSWLEVRYEGFVRYVVKRPGRTLAVTALVSLGGCASFALVPKTFLPPQDNGEFVVVTDLPPGTTLEKMSQVALQLDEIVRKNPEVELTSLLVGSRSGDANEANAYVKLVPSKQRKANTSDVKQRIRDQLAPLAFANPKVTDYDAVGGGQRPFQMNIVGNDQKVLEKIGLEVLEVARKHPGLKDVDINFRPGKPELQVAPKAGAMERLGISSQALGGELRNLVEGTTPAKFREDGREYDIRVRLQENQRDLQSAFDITYVPNVNGSLVRLKDVASPVPTAGPSKINRQDRSRFVQIMGDITPGKGLGDIMNDLDAHFKKNPLPPGFRHAFVGQAENFQEMGQNMMMAMGLGILFIFFVLASLYESFVTPFTIMLALPTAFVGSFLALAVTGASMNLFSWIGIIMLLGVATKNSILLVDYANQLLREGMSRSEALVKAGRTRLRPILMTSMALIAGTLPVALGLNEVSRMRTSMGIAIIGGLISSTLLTLVVVPAAFSFIDRFRVWSKGWMTRVFVVTPAGNGHDADGHGPGRESRSEGIAEAR